MGSAWLTHLVRVGRAGRGHLLVHTTLEVMGAIRVEVMGAIRGSLRGSFFFCATQSLSGEVSRLFYVFFSPAVAALGSFVALRRPTPFFFSGGEATLSHAREMPQGSLEKTGLPTPFTVALMLGRKIQGPVGIRVNTPSVL